MIINNTTNKLTQGLLGVWTNNSRIITSSIYNNSVTFSDFLNTTVIKKVNNLFFTHIERFVTSIEAVKSFVSTKALEIKESFSSYLFETPKLDLRAVYRKAHGLAEEELRILPNLKKINFLPEDSSLDQLLEIGDENYTLSPPLWPRIQQNPINIARTKKINPDQISGQEREIFIKELETFTLAEIPKSNIVEEILQKNKTVNAKLRKFNANLSPLSPLTPQNNPLEEELSKSSLVDWKDAKGSLSEAEVAIKVKRELQEVRIKNQRKVQEVAIKGRKEVQETQEKEIKAKREMEEAAISERKELQEIREKQIKAKREAGEATIKATQEANLSSFFTKYERDNTMTLNGVTITIRELKPEHKKVKVEKTQSTKTSNVSFLYNFSNI